MNGGVLSVSIQRKAVGCNVGDLTWAVILQAWPWFIAAATVFVVAVGLVIARKPKLNRPHPKRPAGTSYRASALRRYDYVIIILDLNLPDMSGFEVRA
jgi:hypothetical protein